MSKQIVVFVALSLLVVFLYFFLGIQRAFFWSVWWWDVLLHFLGGVWVAALFSTVVRGTKIPFSLFPCVALALLVGGAWEAMEYFGDFPPPVFMSYSLDTAKDLVLDMLGGGFGFLILRRVHV